MAVRFDSTKPSYIPHIYAISVFKTPVLVKIYIKSDFQYEGPLLPTISTLSLTNGSLQMLRLEHKILPQSL